MSSSGPMMSRLADDVLLMLWRAGETGAGVTMHEILRGTLAPLPHVQEALENLAARGCRIERMPTEISLAAVGMRAWRDLLLRLAQKEWRRIGRGVFVLPETESTNDVAFGFVGAADGDGICSVGGCADGRAGTIGAAVGGEGGAVDFAVGAVYRAWTPQEVERLTLLAGLAAAVGLERAVERAGGSVPRIEIKWPNDLLVNGKKLGGILVERRTVEGVSGTVVGIGINVGQGAHDFPEALRGRATSLYESCGALIDRARVIAAVLQELDARMGGTESGNSWVDEWKARCPLLGRRVTIRSGERTVSGEVLDISPLQGIIIRDGTGATQWFTSQGSTLGD